MKSLSEQFVEEFKLKDHKELGVFGVGLLMVADLKTWLDRWERDLKSCDVCHTPEHKDNLHDFDYLDTASIHQTALCCESCKDEMEDAEAKQALTERMYGFHSL
jgi:hypothetical protein